MLLSLPRPSLGCGFNQASDEGGRIRENLMLRLTRLLALGALAAGAAVNTAAAGGACCACWDACEPFYVVNQGPLYTGPGIVLGRRYFDFEYDPPPPIYPYIGPTYGYRPYDGPYVSVRRQAYRMRAPRPVMVSPLDPRDK
jgi:hypothetical protein